ncbi:hypothetical protein L1987_43269 [Smallanthus sonchifolius]|uniref:Uncharacterized protein n=1 Tax=Smallanthus sonchifolius TaxID=185202 RepID=A0ACB9GMC3_9ASTR|nr:hypothetical protein L1987_43269 [Smallanthus sonchifolius]
MHQPLVLGTDVVIIHEGLSSTSISKGTVVLATSVIRALVLTSSLNLWDGLGNETEVPMGDMLDLMVDTSSEVIPSNVNSLVDTTRKEVTLKASASSRCCLSFESNTLMIANVNFKRSPIIL